jgi:hypothetical protein
MSTFGEHAAHDPDRAEKMKTGIVSAGSMALAIGGAAAVVLTIMGLSEILPVWMVTLATICVGAAFILEGIAIAGRQIQLLSRTGGTIEQTELAGGLSAEFLAGCAGLALGIIALFGIYPVVLSACAVILFGSALVFGSRSRLSERLDRDWRGGVYRSDIAGGVDVARTDVPRADVSAPSSAERPMEQLGYLLSPVYGTHMMVGLGTMALGIVALAGVRPLVLSLVGLLAVGFALFLSGTAIATRFMYKMARR